MKSVDVTTSQKCFYTLKRFDCLIFTLHNRNQTRAIKYLRPQMRVFFASVVSGYMFLKSHRGALCFIRDIKWPRWLEESAKHILN